MTKYFKEQLEDLKNGLRDLERIIKNPKNTRLHNKAVSCRDIQEARIDFFKRGYNLREKELKEQRTLKTPSKQNANRSEE